MSVVCSSLVQECKPAICSRRARVVISQITFACNLVSLGECALTEGQAGGGASCAHFFWKGVRCGGGLAVWWLIPGLEGR